MSFLINPFIYSSAFPNQYSMQMIRTTTVADIERLFINNQSNAIDTAIRDTTPNISFSMWVKFLSGTDGTQMAVFSKYEDFAGRDRCILLWRLTNNKFRFIGQRDANNLSVDITTDNTYTESTGWFHFCFVYDHSQTTAANIVKLYVNGSEITYTGAVSTTNKFFTNTTTQSFRARVTIGCRYAGAAAGTKADGTGAYVDDFTFWDKSLSLSEVTELYNGGLPKDVSQMSSYSSNCLAWYRMGDASGDSWNGTVWTISNVKGTASTDLTSDKLVEADRVTTVY